MAIWFKADKLALNVKKPRLLGAKKRTTEYIYIYITIDESCIEGVDDLKFLGIYIDCELKWNLHTKNVEKRMAGGLYALLPLDDMNSMKHFLSTMNL